MTYLKDQLSRSSLLIPLVLFAFAGVRIEAAFGDYDPTFGYYSPFGGGGMIVHSGFGVPRAAALQPDGKILVITDTSNAYKLRRFNSNGLVDTNFGFNGVAEFPLPSPLHLSGIAVQPDGKIVVSGNVPGGVYNQGSATVWRLNSGGSADYSFGSNGMVNLSACFVQGSPQLIQNQRGLVPTYDIVVLASLCHYPASYLFRLKPNGDLRTTFGSDGEVHVSAYLATLRVRQGSIYIAQYKSITKFSASTGDPDLTFGDQGVFSESPAMFDGCGNPDAYYHYQSLAFQSTGNLIVGGYRVSGQSEMVHLTRHVPNGSFDTGFYSVPCEAPTNPAWGSFPYEFDPSLDAKVQSDDKIIITKSNRDIVERRMPDGNFDVSFTAYSNTKSVLIQPDGKILVIGTKLINGNAFLALSRYLP